MKIVVCFKIVPDYEVLLSSEWEQPDSLDFAYVKKMYGCFDEPALEMALRIADSCRAEEEPVETIAVTCGAPEGSVSESLLRALFAAGFNDVVLLPQSESFNPKDTAKSLASWFIANPADLVLTGRMVGPGDSGMVPYYLAKELGAELYPEAVSAIWSGHEKRLEVTCKEGSFMKKYAVSNGAVCTVGDGETAYLRLFPLKARMEAKKREFLQPEIREKEEIPEEKPIFSYETKESACRFLGYKSAEEAAKVLLDMLKGETETC